jgi:hypothetical protein
MRPCASIFGVSISRCSWLVGDAGVCCAALVETMFLCIGAGEGDGEGVSPPSSNRALPANGCAAGSSAARV